MAVIKGSEGHVTIGASPQIGVKGWSISETAAEIDTTVMADTGVTDAAYTTGLRRFTLTLNLVADSDVTYSGLRAGTSLAFELISQDGTPDRGYEGTALVTDISPNATVDDDSLQVVTITARGTNALDYDLTP